jgi:class 3 adenylate cyclase/tetratricopeptide (TPR) repeat protein
VLFADIKGSMELIEDIDPEEARTIIDPALRLMIDAVRRYDGYVAQSTGDGVFALFGAPSALEDHPQRALYAALRMQEDFRRYSDRLRSGGKPPVQVRVGVNTGEVVVRTIRTDESHAEYLPIGHSTGLAARMQALAPVGSIAATETTRRLCEGYFTFKSLGVAKVQGVSEPVKVFEVTGFGPLRNRLQRAAGRGLSRFVGREREIEGLRHAAQQVLTGRGQIVAAVAEPGVGKSRLFYEFKARNSSGWMVLEAYPVSHGKASAYLPVIDLLRGYFKIDYDDDERTRREKIAGRLAVLDASLEDTRPYILTLLGIAEAQAASDSLSEQSPDRGDDYGSDFHRKDPFAHMDAKIRRRRTLNAIKRIILRESLNQPIIFIVEDLHWVDQETQTFLDLLADSIATSRVLMLVNYRPEYSNSWTNKSNYSQLRLDPLGRESAELLLSALLGDHPSLFPLRRLMVEKTEGNPFFMEEILQALVEDGSLVRDGSTRLTRKLDQLAIPATVQGILAARIDRLASAQKDLLQTLAVIGKDFPLSLVRALHMADTTSAPTAEEEDRLMSMLHDLQIAEFICEQPTAGDLEYTFKHALTQEVTYKSLLQEHRKLLHGRIGAAIEAVYQDAIDDHLGELAHHYGRSLSGAKAIDYLGRAADQASQRSLHSEALAYVRRGLELASTMPDGDARAREELRLQMIMGVSSMAARGFDADEVERSFARACELARRLNDSYRLFFALSGLWGFYFTRANAEAARKIANESMSVAERLSDATALRHAFYSSGASLALNGELVAARERLEKGLELKDPPGPVPGNVVLGLDPKVLCLTSLSEVLFNLGYPDQSLRRSYEALSAVKRDADPFSYAMAMMFVIQAHCSRGEVEKGEEWSRELKRLSDVHGFPFWLASANRSLIWTMFLRGRFEEAIAAIKQIVDSGETDRNAEVNLYNLLPNMAQAYANMGRLEEGFATLERWLKLYSNRLSPALDKTVWRIRGELLSKAGSMVEAEQNLRRAIELSSSQNAKIEQLRSTTALARLLMTQGRRSEGRSLLSEVYGWFSEGLDTTDLREAKALLDELAR